MGVFLFMTTVNMKAHYTTVPDWHFLPCEELAQEGKASVMAEWKGGGAMGIGEVDAGIVECEDEKRHRLWSCCVCGPSGPGAFPHDIMMTLLKSTQHHEESNTPAKTNTQPCPHSAWHSFFSVCVWSRRNGPCDMTHPAPPHIQMTSGNAIVCFSS